MYISFKKLNTGKKLHKDNYYPYFAYFAVFLSLNIST